jgi:ribose transport system permease protein
MTRVVDASGTEGVQTVAAPGRRHWASRVPTFVPVLIAVVVMMVFTAIQNPAFLGANGWALVVLYASPLIMLAIAITPVLMSGGGGIDLSVGPAAGLIAVVIVGVLVPMGLTSPLLIVATAILLGAISGVLNGTLVAAVRIPPIIATLSTYLIYGGLATYLLSAPVGFSSAEMGWFTSTTMSVPNVAWMLIALIVLWGLLMRTAFGRNLKAVGSNDRAAFTAGVNVSLTRFLAYVLAGIGTGVAGVLLIVVLGGANATVGADYTLQATAAAVLGGVSLMGGRGGVLGAAAGGLLIFLIQNYLTFMAVSTFVLQMVYGIVLIVAILINGGWDALRLRRS